MSTWSFSTEAAATLPAVEPYSRRPANYNQVLLADLLLVKLRQPLPVHYYLLDCNCAAKAVIGTEAWVGPECPGNPVMAVELAAARAHQELNGLTEGGLRRRLGLPARAYLVEGDNIRQQLNILLQRARAHVLVLQTLVQQQQVLSRMLQLKQGLDELEQTLIGLGMPKND